jgi:MinD superfamily P-loop ATPase
MQRLRVVPLSPGVPEAAKIIAKSRRFVKSATRAIILVKTAPGGDYA